MPCPDGASGCGGPGSLTACARCKRARLVLGKEHVNTADYHPNRWGGPADRNCAAVSAAAAVNLLFGAPLWTSRMVAEKMQKDDGKYTMGDDTAQQAKNITTVVSAYGPTKGSRALGQPNEDQDKKTKIGVPSPMAIDWMKRQPEGTVFVVLVDGSFEKGGTAVHWLNAVKESEDTLKFFDYQSDRNDFESGLTKAKGQTKKESTVPFNAQEGAFMTDSNVHVIAFEKRDGAGPSQKYPNARMAPVSPRRK